MRHDQRISRSELPAFEWWSDTQVFIDTVKMKGNSAPFSATTWYWHLRARNGEIIAQGEGYTSKRHVLRAIATVRRNAALAGVRNGR